MNTKLPRPITDAEISAYRNDGIVCIRQAFDQGWVERLRELVDATIREPSEMSKNVNEPNASGMFFYDTFVSEHMPGYRQFVNDSPAADLAATLLGSRKINLIFDQVLAKAPGTSSRTTWHHDLPYWPVAGEQVATLWIALDPVTSATGAVEYVKGSHRWGQRYRAVSFNPDESYDEDLPQVPDIDSQRDQYEFASYEMQPGDCTLHHGLTVHGAPGNTSASVQRRAYILRFAGDDVTYNPRPNLQRMKRDPGIASGQPLDCELFPVIRA